MSVVKLLCAADLHMGRRPSRLPPTWSGGAVGPATAWAALVERARAERVDAVLLAGDVVDRFNRSFEAYGPLRSGVAMLAAAGIPVVAVAGNHDHDTLPDVAAEVGAGNLVVVGRGGTWERWVLEKDGSPALVVHGWSFPSGHWRDDPTADFPGRHSAANPAAPSPPPAPAVPADAALLPSVGLLHADLDQPASPYGPVSSVRLRSLPVSAWVLGHVHGPRLSDRAASTPILYPGSLQALDPGEEGPHGAVLLELAPGRSPVWRQVPLAGARYDTVVVDADGAADAAGVNAAVRTSLQRHLDAIAASDPGPLRVVHCRVRLTGRTAMHGGIEAALDGLGDLDIPHDTGLRLTADPRPIVATRPAHDLVALARGEDAPGLLAALILALDARSGDGPPAPALDALLERATRAAMDVAGRSHFVEAGLTADAVAADDLRPNGGGGDGRSGPEHAEGGDGGGGADGGGGGGGGGGAAVRAALRRQAGRLLDALLAQKEVA